MRATIEMSVSEFKAKCLDLFNQIADHRLAGVTVTRHGRPVAQIGPPPVQQQDIDSLFGFLAGSVTLPADIDLTQPVIDMAEWSPTLPT
ncbi:type II toxin-antitoxin system Phd/YefM family antitoxin [Sphingomonas sp. PB4P5]|uniref:type II toxin-antitoxin system Phd/YefM family antitoxin n=1 Tax=Parasphingomonas puruogangriensis TaxID=3096155 RepID=UPI002FC99305